MILLLCSFVLCFSYIIYIKYKFDVSSISASYYKFENEKKGNKVLFELWTITTSFTLLPCWLEVTNDSYQFVAYLSAVFLAMVGCFPQYKDKDSFTHPFFTSCCAFLALSWGYISNLLYIPMIGILTPLILIISINFKKIKKLIGKYGLDCLALFSTLYYLELGMILSIYVCILIKML